MRAIEPIAMLLLAIVLQAGGLTAQAPAASSESDLLLRVNGPVQLRAGDVAGTVLVIGHDADVAGTVAQDLIVINGTARVSGTVEGNITVVNGHAELQPGARVGQSVLLYRSTLARSPTAVLGGGVHEEMGFSFARAAWLFWLGFTVLVLAAGAGFAFLAQRQLVGASRLLLRQPGGTVLSALGVVVGLPTLAFAVMLTGIGIPLGFALLIFLLPAVAFLGYLVAGASTGKLLLRAWPEHVENPYLAVTAGLLGLQLLALIPGLGGLLVLLASQLGAGALAYRVWRIKHGKRRERAALTASLETASPWL